MNVYLSGPITGKSREELRQSFYRMERAGWAEGAKVYNPARLPEGLSWGTYMQMALDALCGGTIDRMIMLRGWTGSAGARIERLVAMQLGIQIVYEDPNEMYDAGEHAPTINADELIRILQELESDAEEHPECQLKAAPMVRKILGIVEILAK